MMINYWIANATMRSQNLRFDDCRVALSIDKSSLDKVHMFNLRSLVAKSNFFKKLLERLVFINNIIKKIEKKLKNFQDKLKRT